MNLRRAVGAVFTWPVGQPPQTVVLCPGFRESRLVRCIAAPDAIAPGIELETVAGTVDQLRRIADGGVKVSRGLVVFSRIGDRGLIEDDRQYFWDRFGVPVFEQYLSSENQLLACECDAHDGLHLVAGGAPPEGFVLDPCTCPCGDSRPRLRRIAVDIVKTEQACAVSA